MEIDHAVVLVEDLDAAIRQWRDAGFTVTPGGVHADGFTHNALICFADGSYIELLTFLTTSPTGHRWERHRRHPGLIDYALAINDLPAFVRDLARRGLAYSAISEGGRRRPDGVELRWRSSWPPQSSQGLPFLIEDLTPREWRVPAGGHCSHANGAQGIAALDVAVTALDDAALALGALFGLGEAAGRVFRAGQAIIRLGALDEDDPQRAASAPGWRLTGLTIGFDDGSTREYLRVPRRQTHRQD